MRSLVTGIRVLGLAVVNFVAFAVVGSVVMPRSEQIPEDAIVGALLLTVVCLVNAVAVTYILRQSRWEKWPRIGVLLTAFFGSTTVMTQIETAFFVATVSAEVLIRICVVGALVSAVFTVVAGHVVVPVRVAVPVSLNLGGETRLVARRLPVIVPVYLALYFVFGYFIAWQNADLRKFYGGGELVGFTQHILNVAGQSPWLFPFQAGRAILWTLLALPVVRMTGDSRVAAGISLALLFGAVMNAQLILPNPYMPAEVRLVHLVETASSNVIFGFVLAYLLFQPYTDTRDQAEEPVAPSWLASPPGS